MPNSVSIGQAEAEANPPDFIVFVTLSYGARYKLVGQCMFIVQTNLFICL